MFRTKSRKTGAENDKIRGEKLLRAQFLRAEIEAAPVTSHD
jgi:hypothetical protein